MSTSTYNPNERNLPLTGVAGGQALTNAESETCNVVGSQPSLRSSSRGDNCGCDYSKESDDDLLAGAQCGDQQAFVELCSRHSSMVKNKILRIVQNQEDAEDALQDTLMRAYTNLTSFRRSCKFSTWLITIGVNSALMIMRKRRVRREAYANTSSLDTGTLGLQEPVDRSLGHEGIYLRQQAILLVRRQVERLPPGLRSIVTHCYGSDCSLEETAKSQEISLAAAKSRLLRGRVRLRSSLARHGMSKSRN